MSGFDRRSSVSKSGTFLFSGMDYQREGLPGTERTKCTLLASSHGFGSGHLALLTESERPRDLTRPVYPAAVFPSSFFGLCPLLTSSSYPLGIPGNSPWCGGREEWFVHCPSWSLAAWCRWVDYRRDWLGVCTDLSSFPLVNKQKFPVNFTTVKLGVERTEGYVHTCQLEIFIRNCSWFRGDLAFCYIDFHN